MNKEKKKKIVTDIIARVSTGFAFIEHKYIFPQRNAGGPDLAWIRSIYILFSYHFEILLKSAFILTQSFTNEEELNIELKKLGHNIEAIAKKLENTNLDIKNVSLKDGEYIIVTSKKTIYVKDFNDIRYDFVGGKLRKLPANEDSIIKDSLEGADEILKKIKLIVYSVL